MISLKYQNNPYLGLNVYLLYCITVLDYIRGANVFSDPWFVTLQASLATHLFISAERASTSEEGKDPASAIYCPLAARHTLEG